MLSIPKEVTDILKQGSVRKNFRVHFPNGERADIINNNIVSESVRFTDSICSKNSLSFGLCESPQIEFETFNVGNIKNSVIECSLDVDATDIPQTKTCTISETLSKTTSDLKNLQFNQDVLEKRFDLQGWGVSESQTIRINYRLLHNCAYANAPALITTDISLEYEYSINGVKHSVSTTKRRSDYIEIATSTGRRYVPYRDDYVDISLNEGDCIDYIKFNVYDYKYKDSSGAYNSFVSTITLNFSLDLHLVGREQKSDLDYVSYPVSLGRFVVDSCKKQADMTHRQIIAYAYTSFEWNNSKEIVRYLNDNFYWGFNDLKLSLEGIIKITSMDSVVFEDWEHYTEYDDEPQQLPSGKYFSAKYRTYCKDHTYLPDEYDETECIQIVKEVYDETFASVARQIMAEITDDDKDAFFELCLSMKPELQYYKSSADKWYHQKRSGTTRYENTPSFVNGNITTYPFMKLQKYSSSDIFEIECTNGYYMCFTQITLYDEDMNVLYSTADCPNNKLMFDSEPTKLFESETGWYIKPNKTKKSLKMYYEDTSTYIKKTAYSYDFSEVFELNPQELIQSYCEIVGKFGRVNKNGRFEIYSINDNFVNPNAGTISVSDYSSLWYEDEISKPIGRIGCTFKVDKDETEYTYYDLVSDFNSSDYKTYSLDNNYFIKNNIYTEEQILAFMETMAQNIGNISYMPVEMTMVGRPDIEVGDAFYVELKDGTKFVSFLEQRTLNGIIALTDTVASKDEQASVLSGSSSGSYNTYSQMSGLMPKVLWQNESPSSSFAGQTIELSDEIETYDYIGIICAQSNGSTGRTRLLPMIFIPVGLTTGAYITMCTYRNYVRAFSSISGSSITVGACSYYATYGSSTTTPDNTALIPRQVIGFSV